MDYEVPISSKPIEPVTDAVPVSVVEPTQYEVPISSNPSYTDHVFVSSNPAYQLMTVSTTVSLNIYSISSHLHRLPQCQSHQTALKVVNIMTLLILIKFLLKGLNVALCDIITISL